jgi:arylsulfatase A-like enzyme
MKFQLQLAIALLILNATIIRAQDKTDKARNQRPNIVLIMADDMGYSDVGCYGGEINTPNIDSLANEGLRFSQFYNCAVCGTTRASLMTGLYHHQVGVRSWNGIRNNKCLNIGEAMQEAGYRTMMVGKWTDIQSPNFKGFDRSFGSLAHKGPTNYFKMNHTDDHFLDKDVYTLPEEGYFKTDSYTDYAVRFLRQTENKNQPFFLYVAYLAPHWPLHAKEKDIAKYRKKYRELGWDQCHKQRYERQQQMKLISDSPPVPRDSSVSSWKEAEHQDWQAERMAVYAAQVDCIDQNVGRILKTMQEIGCEDNTVVMFLSDNGATGRTFKPKANGRFFLDSKTKAWRTDGTRTKTVVPGIMPGPADTFGGYGLEWAHVSNTPVRGYKQSSYEGGIITPLIVKWPGKIAPVGKITHQVGHVIDVMPTCLEIASMNYPKKYRERKILPVEGKSLVPVFKGKKRQGHSALFWELSGNRAVRMGKWKLVGQTKKDWELYNLKTDRGEANDLASLKPDLVKKMTVMYQEWSERCNEGR